MVVAALVLAVFGLDLATGIPLHQASMLMDGAFIVFALILGYLGWTTYREQE